MAQLCCICYHCLISVYNFLFLVSQIHNAVTKTKLFIFRSSLVARGFIAP